MNDLQIFENSEFGKIRMVTEENEPWFCLRDVCKVLELTAKGVKQRLSDEVISNYPIEDTVGRIQNALFVNEDGLYDVILESRKPNARAFRKWITGEVLPSIRKNGGYIANQENLTPEQIVANALVVAQNIITQKDKQIEEMTPTSVTPQRNLVLEKKHLFLSLLKKDMFSDRGNIENCVHMPNTQRAETACLS